jgi:hypothetical protein
MRHGDILYIVFNYAMQVSVVDSKRCRRGISRVILRKRERKCSDRRLLGRIEACRTDQTNRVEKTSPYIMQKSLFGGRSHFVSKTNVENETFILLRHFVQYLPRVESQLPITDGIEREESIETICRG